MKYKGHDYNNMEEFLKANGISASELNTVKYYAYDFSLARQFITSAIADTGTIYVIGDYDADGILSTKELSMIIQAFGGRCIRRIPKRISEGYGLSESIIEEIPKNQWLITVDNGISAFAAIEKAKEKGIKVMVLDHHLPDSEDETLHLPKADVIYDAHIDHAEWKDYCAAGMVYKLAEFCFGPGEFTDQIAILAAIATVADMVPMKGDNRQLVRYGLALLNQKKNIPLQIKKLLEVCSLHHVSEQDFGFTLGPIINACGRLSDDGAQFVSNFFEESDKKKLDEMASALVDANTKRKEIVAEASKKVYSVLGKPDEASFDKVICLYMPGLPEGIIGLLAGSIAKDYGTAAFIMTDASGGEIKGSARGSDRLHIKDALAKNSEYLTRFGGHAGAGGFSLKKENLEAFQFSIQSEQLLPKEPYDYDFSIKQADIPMWYHIKSQYAPFGVGVPEPVFHIDVFEAFPRYNKFHECNGVNKTHLKIFGSGCDALGFDMAEVYEKINCPKRVELIGKITVNYYNNKEQLQIRIEKLKKIEATTRASKELLFLQNLVEEKQNNG